MRVAAINLISLQKYFVNAKSAVQHEIRKPGYWTNFGGDDVINPDDLLSGNTRRCGAERRENDMDITEQHDITGLVAQMHLNKVIGMGQAAGGLVVVGEGNDGQEEGEE